MSVCHVNKHGVIETGNGVCLREPAVQIIGEDDILVRFGEYSELINKAEIETKAMIQAKIAVPVQTVVNLYMLPVETSCYIIRRMVEYTGSGFIRNFNEKMTTKESHDWIKAEMRCLPIDVYK